MIVTEEWLETIKDEKGYTKGQIEILNFWAKGEPLVGIEVSETVAKFLVICKGWRNGRYEKSIAMQHSEV
jgi:hypothetical protein